MPTPQGDITSSQILSPVEETQDDLHTVPGSGEPEPTGEAEGSEEESQEV